MTNSHKPTRPFSSARLLARSVMICFAFCILIDLVAVILSYSQITLLSKALTNQTIYEGDATADETQQQIIVILQFAAYLITGVLFLTWIYRTHRNLPALGIPGPRYSPAWAVGWFFVPIFGLFRPYEVMQELYKGCNPDVGISDEFLRQYSPTVKLYSSKTALIGLWWGFWLASIFLTRISDQTHVLSGLGGLIIGNWLSIISDGFGIVAAVCVILIVKEIDARQEEKHKRLAVDRALQNNLALEKGT